MNPFPYLSNADLLSTLEVKPFGGIEIYCKSRDITVRVLNFGNIRSNKFAYYFYIFEGGTMLNPEGSGYTTQEIKEELFKRKVQDILK